MRKVRSNKVYVGVLITLQSDCSKSYTSWYLTDNHEPIMDRQSD